MGDINNYVNVTISRETQTISRTGFGIPAIVSEFPANVTTPNFNRTASYSNLTEMVDAGWATTSKVYLRATKIFIQNPRPAKIIVGRKKPKSELVETWTQALTAILSDNREWYGLTVDTTAKSFVTFNIDFVVSNSILATINGVVCSPVIFSTDQLTTMNLLKVEIELKIPGSVVTIGTTPYRTMTIELESGDISTATIVTTLGVTQPVATITFTEQDDILEIASWVEANKKIFCVTDNDPVTITSGTSDLASLVKALSYNRTIVCYHPNFVSNNQFFAEALLGRFLPTLPGSIHLMYKNLKDINSVNLTSSERTFALNKKCNIYIPTAGINMIEAGTVAIGEYINVIRDIDWVEARIQEEVFSLFANIPILPYTPEGISLLEGVIRSVLEETVRFGVFLSYTLTMPVYEEISQQDKIAGKISNIKFTGILSGAILYVYINGTITF